MVDVLAAAIGLLWLVGVVLLVRGVDWGWLRWGAGLALLACVVAGLGVYGWRHRPQSDVGHLRSWLDAECVSVDVSHVAAHDATPSASTLALDRASMGGTSLYCNELGGALEVLRFASAGDARRELAADRGAQRYATCVAHDHVVVDHLDGPGYRTFRHWCDELHGQYQPHARRRPRS